MDQLFERLRGALADRYAVEREIGAGGMATVFLAQDLRHRRPVALKVVRPELGGPLALDRFLREIELAARLQHPHILPVFDSGVVETGTGQPLPWFVMPFVEGESLRHRLQREGALPAGEAVELAAEVADALAYAHRHGVVHRDIKPENILLSGGHAVVADFGVAKAIESGAAAAPPSAGGQLTAVGIAIGTPAYMSPEQATGRDVVDARADQYSLGCVLYEILAGAPPFAGGSAQSVIALAMTAPRPRPSRARAGVPAALDAVVTRAMAADPEARFPDMAALGAALRGARGAPKPGRGRLIAAGVAIAAAAAAAAALVAGRSSGSVVSEPAETIAVLPFNASGAGTEVLGEGMVDLLATNLEGVGGIRTVEPRLVLRRWSGTAAGGLDRALALGRELDAGSIVTGSAVSTGGRVRLAADLYAVASGERLGRAQVDGPADSVLPLVDRLSVALLRDVWRSREPLPNLSIASVTTDSIAALRAFLQGERYYRALALDSALDAYTRAVEVDSTFALAHFRRALVYGWTGGYGSPASHEAAAAGFRFGARLPARSRRLLEGYRLFDRGSQSAIDSLGAYLATYPDDTEGWFTYGEALFHLRDIAPRDPDTIMAAFDRVIAADSALTPAVVHPLELSLVRRDSARFRHYQAIFERSAAPEHIKAHRVAAGLAWGPPPSDSALAEALRTVPYPVIYAVSSTFRDDRATSDTVLDRFEKVSAGLRSDVGFNRGQLIRGFALVGLGRLRESRVVADSVARFAPGAAVGLLGYPVVLGLARTGGGQLDSLLARDPARVGSPRRTAYTDVVRLMMQGRPKDARAKALQSLALPDTTADSATNRGLLRAAAGWARVVEGDSAAGIAELKSGIVEAYAPNNGEITSFLRFQLALALASRPESRADGINRLRHGFESSALYLLPLADLALGRTYEAAGKRDSAALAYGRFLRMWDKADPELQGRVSEARDALHRLTAEPRP